MNRAKKLPSGNWRVRVPIGRDQSGKVKMLSITRMTKKEAEHAAAEAVADRERIRCPSDTFRAAQEAYIRSKYKILSPLSIATYRALQRQGTDFDYMDTSKITAAHIQAFINRYAATHSPKSVRNMSALISATMRSVRPDFRPVITLPQKRKPEYRIPTADDVKQLLAIADPQMRLAIMLAVSIPARRAEVCALRHEDLSDGVLHIHANMIEADGKFIYKETTKTSAGDRRVALPAALLREIGTGDGYLIGLHPNAVTKRFKRLCARIGKNYNFHSLRHYGASLLHSAGIPDSYLMERGGWESDETLKSVYRHALSEESKHFAAVADEKLSEIF